MVVPKKDVHRCLRHPLEHRRGVMFPCVSSLWWMTTNLGQIYLFGSTTVASPRQARIAVLEVTVEDPCFWISANLVVPHLRGSFLWARLRSGPLQPGELYLGRGQGPTSSTVFGDKINSLAPPGVEPSYDSCSSIPRKKLREEEFYLIDGWEIFTHSKEVAGARKSLFIACFLKSYCASPLDFGFGSVDLRSPNRFAFGFIDMVV
ncbi:hypothetical protein HID58_046883 [Brassica napus]|uniref:Uncharacterized protein n=1 Tax=Brassica napus TaxID=3708 RepID=A0ABQ8AXN3_BRANA|nr:hypothetical protein HID58_046883 [Brassica napus]